MRVRFPIKKEDKTNILVYPDGKKYFSNVEIDGTDVLADYSGAMSLTIYTPDPVPTVDPVNMADATFRKLVLEKLGICCS